MLHHSYYGSRKIHPKEIYDEILEWAVIPTFDLVIEYGAEGIIIIKRKVAPYQNLWALPGRRMLKGESIEDTLIRIANQEGGLLIDPSERTFLGQYVGKFATMQNRQDISTGYSVRCSSDQKISFDKNRYSSMNLVKSRDEIPSRIGSMYAFFLNRYFDLK